MVKLLLLSSAKITHIQSLVLINTHQGGATLLKGPPKVSSLLRFISSFNHHQLS